MAALTPEKFKVIGYTEEDANRIDRPTISYWQDAWRRLRKNPIAMGSLVVLGILLVMVIIGPHIKGYEKIAKIRKNEEIREIKSYYERKKENYKIHAFAK